MLLSINPEHVEKILTGQKQFEFRKVRCRSDVSKIVIYATSPVMKIVGEADGMRDINVRLTNDSDIPLKGNDKTVEVQYFLDSSYEKSLMDADGNAVKTVIRPEDADAMELVDNGAYVTQLNVDAAAALDALYGNDQTEIPESGVTVYAKAALYDDYETDDQAAVEEERKANNEKNVTFRSLTSQTGGEELTFENITVTEDEENGKLTVGMSVSNNTMDAKKVGNVMVELLDADGNVVAAKQTFDSEKSMDENAIDLAKEGVADRTVEFDLAEIGGAGLVASVNCYVCSTEAEVTFDLDGKSATVVEPQAITLGEKATAPAETPTSGDYRFEGWFADATYLEPFDFENAVITMDTTIYAKWKSYAPEIKEHPASMNAVYDGKDKTLSVVAECVTGEMTYQWFKDGTAIEGATENTFAVREADEDGTYYCEVTTVWEEKPFTVRSDAAKVGITQRSLTVTADSESKRYDGTELTKPTYKITEGTLAYGDNLEVEIAAAVTDKGEVPNAIESAVVKRGETDVTDNYELTTVDGTLRVTETEQEEFAPLIVAQPGSLETTYDGKDRVLVVSALCDYAMEYQWYKNGAAIQGATDRTHAVRDVADSGSYSCEITTEIGGETVVVKSSAGVVGIKKAPLTITAHSRTKVHDGKELRDGGYEYAGTLADGQKLYVQVSGRITKPGKAKNVVTTTLVRTGNEDKTANYDIKKVGGVLKVTKGKNYAVKYRKNVKGKVSGNPVDVKRYKYNKKAKVMGAPSSKKGFFAGWNTMADGSGKTYKANKKITVKTNVDLYAQWEKTYTDKNGLTYKKNSNKKTVTVTKSSKKNPKIPARIKYKGVTYKVTEVANGVTQ